MEVGTHLRSLPRNDKAPDKAIVQPWGILSLFPHGLSSVIKIDTKVISIQLDDAFYLQQIPLEFDINTDDLASS